MSSPDRSGYRALDPSIMDTNPDAFLDPGTSTSDTYYRGQRGWFEYGRDWISPRFFVGDPEDDGVDDREQVDKKIIVGICAMAKKSNSKPMKEIVRRLVTFHQIQIIIFEEDIILNKPVEEWPIVNAFISFFSHGFPLDKAIAYKNLRHPFVVNDLEMQYILQDRTEVYRLLEEHKIPHPRYAVLNKEKYPNSVVVETEDSIDINGHFHPKPFVEKPISAEDHNVYIYFPQAAGGGSTRLFRKVKDRSSVYSHTSRVRRNGAYIYEDFMPTDGTDVKVYTVGMDYQHAEARKSPALDGKVERDKDGKEIRYPVLLSAREKLIARKVCRAFKQNVCGFDLLRASGMCYVCDVNGFSFVKTSNKYYDDCARILGTLVLRSVCPTLHIPYPFYTHAPEDLPVVPTTSGSMMELRCVVALIRHGDRTPKQKMKMEVKNKQFFELFEKYGGFKSGQLKLKRPKQLQEVLDIVRDLLAEIAVSSEHDMLEKKAKLQQMKLVLEMYGHFSGINRKVQLKYQPKGRPKRSSSEEDDTPRDPSLLLILKWGGELTPAGRIQAENLGKAFRTLYPGGQGQFDAPGLGFLRLHSTFRHDLKIYASDEGRVQMTAAAFTKGLLALEGELTPILVQMVKSANTNGLLDGEGKTSKCQIVVKEKLKEVMNQDHDFNQEDFLKLNPTNTLALTNAMEFVKNPRSMCRQVFQMIKEITAKIRSLKAELKTRDLTLYNGESWELLIRRWAKLEKDFQLKCGRFEISKIPDIYDCIKYDLQHNQKTLNYERANELFMCSKALADIIIPQEYGIEVEEKLHIAQNFCTPILRKIRSDFLQVINPNFEDSTTRLDSRYSKGVSSPERFVRTRLYFTSESHIHSVLNMLRYGVLFEEGKDCQWESALSFLNATAELNYMSQIVFMLFEDPSKDLDSDERYHMELHFSPGAHTSCDEPTEPRGMGYRPKQSLQIGSGGSSESVTRTPFKLVSAFSGPLPSRHLRLETASHSDLCDISESEMFETSTPVESPQIVDASVAIPGMGNKVSKIVSRAPGSPDPTIPDWDWGDDNDHYLNPDRTSSVDFEASAKLDQAKKKGSEDNCEEPFVSSPTQADSNKQLVSQPINIAIVTPTSGAGSPNKGSLDEKRSRSLDDKNDGTSDSAFQRHYKTVHLPLYADMANRRILPSVFSLGFGFSGMRALEGFSYVPLLHPLETLHNNLTFREMDDFLGRITTTRFPMPAISPTLVATRPSLMLASPGRFVQSNPPSSNSSSGPSTPTSVATPIDFLQNLRMFMKQGEEQDQDTDSSHSSGRREPTSAVTPGSDFQVDQDPSVSEINACTTSTTLTDSQLSMLSWKHKYDCESSTQLDKFSQHSLPSVNNSEILQASVATTNAKPSRFAVSRSLCHDVLSAQTALVTESSEYATSDEI